MFHLSYKRQDSLDSFKRFDPNNWDELKERINCKVINKKLFDAQDKDNVIHTNVADITTVFTVSEVDKKRESINFYELTEEDLERLGKTKNDIIKEAENNIKYNEERRIITLKQEHVSKDSLYPLLKVPENAFMGVDSGLVIQDTDKDKDNILIVSNKYSVFGASYMLDFKTLREIKERMQSDFYIIPMSVHQLMCVSSNYITKDKPMREAEDDLLDMLFKINSENKKAEDILSNKIYKYLSDDGEILLPIKQRL